LDALTFGRLRGVGRLDHALLVLSIASSAAFMATRSVRPFPGAVVLKALSIATLAVVAFRVLDNVERSRDLGRRGIRDSRILSTALVLSCAGDVFLQLDFRRYFMDALVAFLLAHVAYIVLFIRNWPRRLRPAAWQRILAALVLVHGLLLCAWLWAGLGRLVLPALAYGLALVAMTVSAIFARCSRPFVAIGALLFLISDSLLAARLRVSMPLAAILIWPTYYLGQYGIALGFLGEKAAADRTPALRG
jgi:uncharacterized membrane protein YhhN